MDYEEIRKIRPDIIMLRTSNQGQTGPHANQLGFGMAYTDMIAPRLGAAVLIAALDYRRRTGRGQLLDLS